MDALRFLGIGIVLWIGWKFVYQLGKGLPILELLLLISGLQWIIGPILSYTSKANHYKYYMYVDESTYMGFVIPAFFSFALIILRNKRELFRIEEIEFSHYSKYGKYILCIGVIIEIVSRFAPPSLQFMLFLISQMKFIGAGLLLFSSSRKDQLLFYGALVYLFFRSLGNAMFHDLLIWGVFMFMLWSIKKNPSLKTKLGVVCAGLLLSITIQTAKAPFRDAVWGGFKGNKFVLFTDIINERLETGFLQEESNQEKLNVRLNQGWIISAILNHTPAKQKFANGETIWEAIKASLLPRVLDNEKKVANGRENFSKYTGITLASGTSMGLSILGESYANFGPVGGIIFMVVWGGVLVIFWNILVRLIDKFPMLLFFIPLIFLQVIKAESEMLTVLNHMFKSTLLVYFFYLFSTRFLNFSWNSLTDKKIY